jgi:hypothetical protein
VKEVHEQHILSIPILQDSFELPGRDSSRDRDIEMGMNQADASDNLKDFLKKVLLHTHFSLCMYASCLSYNGFFFEENHLTPSD